MSESYNYTYLTEAAQPSKQLLRDTNWGSWSQWYTTSIGGTIQSFTYRVGKAGYRNRSWQARMAAGEIVVSPYSNSVKTGELRWDFDLLGQKPYGNRARYESVATAYGIPPSQQDVTLASEILNQANLSYFSKLSEAFATWQSLVTLAEGRKTVESVSRTVKALHTTSKRHLVTITKRTKRAERLMLRLKNLRRQPAAWHLEKRTKHTIRQFRKSRRSVSSAWLQYRMEVLPLMADVDAAVTALTTEKPMIRRVRGSAKYSTRRETQTGFNVQTIFHAVFHQLFVEHSVEYKADVVGYFSITPSNLQKFGIDRTGFAAGLWEATKWSFLVDYFYRVGDLITAKLLYNVHPDRLVYSQKYVQSTRPSRIVTQAHPSDFILQRNSVKGHGRVYYATFNRGVSHENLPPRLMSCRPLSELSALRSVNMVALARSMTKQLGSYKALTGFTP